MQHPVFVMQHSRADLGTMGARIAETDTVCPVGYSDVLPPGKTERARGKKPIATER